MLRIDFIKVLLSSAVISPFYKFEKNDYQKIYISQFFIAGFRHYKGMELLPKMQVGDVLSLVREPENIYDDCAIALHWNNEKIGFIPADNNEMLSTMLDADDLKFIGEITHIELETQPWENIAVAISYLKKVDFTKNKNIPKYLTEIEEPVYKTKISKINIESDIDNPIELNNNFEDYDISQKVVLFIGDFTGKELTKRKNHIMKYLPIIKDKNGNEFFLISTDERYDFLYEIMHSKWMEAENGHQYIRGIFHNKKNKKPYDNLKKINSKTTLIVG